MTYASFFTSCGARISTSRKLGDYPILVCVAGVRPPPTPTIGNSVHARKARMNIKFPVFFLAGRKARYTN
jgi:hypothetical protein